MASHTCPICDEQFRASGAVRDHAWEIHDACHYCGEQLDDEKQLYTHWLTSHPDEITTINYKKAEAAVDSLTFTERLSNQGISAAVGGLRRRTLLLAGGTILAGGVATVATTLTKGDDAPDNGNRNAEPESQKGPVATVSVPPSPGGHRYAVAGTDADVTVTYLGSWKCPHCARFSTSFLPTLVRDYVEPGKITLEYRNLTYLNGEPFLGPDAPAAGRAGLAVWNDDPASYWAYHEHVMANQPSENGQWATADRLVSFAKKAGVTDSSVVRTAIQATKYEEALRATSEAATKAGVRGTPRLLVDGTTVSPFEKDRTRRLIDEAIA